MKIESIVVHGMPQNWMLFDWIYVFGRKRHVYLGEKTFVDIEGRPSVSSQTLPPHTQNNACM